MFNVNLIRDLLSRHNFGIVSFEIKNGQNNWTLKLTHD